MPGDSGSHLVLFDQQIAVFIANIVQAVLRVVPLGPADATGTPFLHFTIPAVTGQIKSDPDIAQHFENTVLYYAVTGRLDRALGPVSFLDLPTPTHSRLSLIMQMAMWYFVLGHEYAHVLLGHLHTTGTRKGILAFVDAEALDYSWQQEHDADACGLVLAEAASAKRQGDPVLFAHLGICLFFDALDVMDRAIAVLQTGNENALQLGSHPPPRLRKQHLHELVLPRMRMDQSDGEYVREGMREMASASEEVIRLLWERTRPRLLDLHRQGVSASPTWRTTPKQASDNQASPH